MRSKSRWTTGYNLKQLLQPWLALSLPNSASRKQRYMDKIESLSSTAISWTKPEELVVENSRPLPHCSREMTTGEKALCPTYSWADNPWILDRRGDPLTARKYNKIHPCTIVKLGLQRIRVHTYSFVIPSVGHKKHQQAKLRR